MDEDDAPVWPAHEDDEQPDESAPSDEAKGEDEATSTSIPVDDAPVEGASDGDGDHEVNNLVTEPWTLPVRAAPILALQGETVVEFPLSQHLNGLESTSLVMDDELMRIVEARYDADGVRRLNVRMALVKEHISGYSHTHLDLFQKLQAVWWGSIGFGLLTATSVAQGLLALGSGAFVLAGVAGLLMAKLDLHRLSFSDHGGRHDFYLSGWRQEPYLIHNSTALLGPAFVDFLRTSKLDTEHIDAVIETMGAPALPAPELKTAPEPPTPASLPEPTASSTPALPPPPVATDLPAPAPPVSSGPPISSESPPAPQPLPPPPAPVHVNPPAPVLPPAPLPAPLPPAPLPPPLAPEAPRSEVDEDALWDDLN